MNPLSALAWEYKKTFGALPPVSFLFACGLPETAVAGRLVRAIREGKPIGSLGF